MSPCLESEKDTSGIVPLADFFLRCFGFDRIHQEVMIAQLVNRGFREWKGDRTVKVPGIRITTFNTELFIITITTGESGGLNHVCHVDLASHTLPFVNVAYYTPIR